jgi:hypothetical protein
MDKEGAGMATEGLGSSLLSHLPSTETPRERRGNCTNKHNTTLNPWFPEWHGTVFCSSPCDIPSREKGRGSRHLSQLQLDKNYVAFKDTVLMLCRALFWELGNLGILGCYFPHYNLIPAELEHSFIDWWVCHTDVDLFNSANSVGSCSLVCFGTQGLTLQGRPAWSSVCTPWLPSSLWWSFIRAGLTGMSYHTSLIEWYHWVNA